jgi:PBP1b-binding outer membrane lipoprotein LpoB
MNTKTTALPLSVTVLLGGCVSQSTCKQEVATTTAVTTTAAGVAAP